MQWIIAASTAVLVFIVLKSVQWFVVKRISKLVKNTTTELDDLLIEVVRKTHILFLFVAAFYIGANTLSLLPDHRLILHRIFILVLLVQGGVWIGGAISFWLDRTIKRRLVEDAAGATTLTALGFIIQLVLWTIVLLVALANLGIDITAMVAGLGIGGIAVALALQNILADLFSSLSIVLDKPFVIGDFIIVDNYLGTVEHIGLKTTRLRSLAGEQIIFSNSDLLKSRLRNYKRMFERRVEFRVNVAYQTSYEKISVAPKIIREIIESQKNIRFDRSHYKEYAESSLVMEAVYFVLSPDFNLYMDIQQAINLEIHRRFSREKIDFALPTSVMNVKYNQKDAEDGTQPLTPEESKT